MFFLRNYEISIPAIGRDGKCQSEALRRIRREGASYLDVDTISLEDYEDYATSLLMEGMICHAWDKWPSGFIDIALIAIQKRIMFFVSRLRHIDLESLLFRVYIFFFLKNDSRTKFKIIIRLRFSSTRWVSKWCGSQLNTKCILLRYFSKRDFKNVSYKYLFDI